MIVELDVTCVLAFPGLVVTSVTILRGLAVTNVKTSSVSNVIGTTTASEPQVFLLDGSHSYFVMIGE